MHRRHPLRVECPPELVRFDPADWPASDRDVEVMGESQRGAFHAWQRWLHARADFCEDRDLPFDALPSGEVPPEVWQRVREDLWGSEAAPPTRTSRRPAASTPTKSQDDT